MAYITVAQMRAEGVTDPPYDDAYVTSRIALAQAVIERILGKPFEKKEGLVIKVDGRGHPLIWLPIPPISESAISKVELLDIYGEAEEVDTTEYMVDMPAWPDGRHNPKLVNRGGVWPKGIKNIQITGDFGFVDIDDEGACTTPELIQRLCILITKWALPQVTDDAGRRSGQIVEESLKDYRYRLNEAANAGMFGDEEIDGIIGMFWMPGMGTA